MPDKAATIKGFRELEMILPNDDKKQIEFYYKAYKEMISLFALPYVSKTFDFSKPDFFEKLYAWGEKIGKMPEFKQPRGVKHFIYVNRTNFGLYTLLNELNAIVNTQTFQPHFERFSGFSSKN